MEILLWIAVVVLVLVGLAGVVLPALPGTPFVFIGLLLAAYIDDFTRVGWPTLTILGVLTAMAIGVDFFATALGAKRVGATSKAMWGATLGTIVGIPFGFVGLIVGPFIGAVVGELIARRDLIQASKVGVGTWIGILLGVAMKIALIFTMLGVFITAYFI
ncbi:MAG: DUF456 domain-containing protein [Burkholderiales bacterium]|nr:DUF456 domain-containing protein [Burkholderiales bacterium]